ncbi:hypothetical protein SAMN03159338_4250 [Sphingomonas sp. NFR04]|uniref:hypothetical protein n=1 Tax=Sphingomonas sp. NFR04 TaxID=1566283 RepID=UPI0008EB0106|nr:hypothetical protein [Sphingomonas sp. NFR04]SFK44031.1 hypothetical protein SAMN03159338_4250 [Sphingomonas sp. NFR04]
MTFQYGQITASTPLAFGTPVLALPPTGAVVSVRKALGALPAGIADAVLENLTGCTFEEAREIASRDLSPGMLAAFLAWLDAAIAYWSYQGEDDDGYIMLGDHEQDAVNRIRETKCETPSDEDVVTFLDLLDLLDAAPLGKGLRSWAELEGNNSSHDRVTLSIRDALLSRSPLVRALAFGDKGVASPDAQLLAAFAGVRQGMSYLLGMRHDLNDRVPDWERMCAAFDDEVHAARARTIEGVVAKLRVAFQHIACQSWSDLVVVDPTDPEFVNGIRSHSDANEQLLWDCIEDLARIGGIDLSQQGAEQRSMVLA